MTKYMKRETEVIKERWIATKTFCDLCERDVDEVSRKVNGSYDYTRIKLEARIGSSYPEGDSRKGFRLDTCVECFELKIKPATEALGIKWHEFDVEDAYPSQYGDYYREEPAMGFDRK